MIPPGALVGLLPAVLLAVCLFSPGAVGLNIADEHGSARENERKKRLGHMGLEGRVSVEPDEDLDDGFGPYEGGPFDGEPDTHVYDFEKEHLMISRRSRGHSFPRNVRVALVLRGASFRHKHSKQFWCLYDDLEAQALQKKATESLVENVIVPLEQAGNTVDVIVTDHDCPLTRPGGILISWIGEQRVKVVALNEGADQNRNLLFALDTLAKYSDGVQGVAAKYSYVFVMRYDTVWMMPMNSWPEADFTKVLFPYKCPLWNPNRGNGVHDLFMLAPAQFFETYYKTVEKRQCFQRADGHLCLDAMARYTGYNSVDVAIHYDANINTTEFWYTYGKARAVC